MKVRLALLGVATFALAGCGAGQRLELKPGPHLTMVSSTELPPPTDEDISTSERPYRIGPFDQLSINVFGIPELSQTVQVDASGRIFLPLVGALSAVDKTPEEISTAIEQRLRGQYVRDPQVTINLLETVSRVITVDGQVREPGLYPVLGRMTLMRAVATARGTTEFAQLEDVVVFRTVGKQDMVALYNLHAIREGSYRDPELYANDVVIVGDSPSRRMFKDLIATAPLIVSPIVALIR